jgi:hypothetical protein
MVIDIVVDHPLDVPLSPAHLSFFLAFPFPFGPALHPKAGAKVRGLALKGDFIEKPSISNKSYQIFCRKHYQTISSTFCEVPEY